MKITKSHLKELIRYSIREVSDELKKETEISSPDNSFAPISEEEVKKLSAYSKFIETLNTDDIK